MAVEYFDYQSLAKRNAVWMGVQELKSMLPDEHELNLWQKASDALKHNEFANAQNRFKELSVYSSGILKQASQWNALMSHFALHGRDSYFEIHFQEYLNSRGNPYHQRAIHLEHLMQNPAYINFIRKSPERISSLKPRLM
jgi:hypothetical protein